MPALVYLLRFPVHTATATSLFVLTITAFVGSVTHLTAGLFHQGIRRAIALSVGAVIGAQLGAKLSERIHGQWIIRSLGVALGFSWPAALGGIAVLICAQRRAICLGKLSPDYVTVCTCGPPIADE